MTSESATLRRGSDAAADLLDHLLAPIDDDARPLPGLPNVLSSRIDRVVVRPAFGSPPSDRDQVRNWIAESCIDKYQGRLLTLHTAKMTDSVAAKAAHEEIAMIKAVAPTVATRVLDRAVQVWGAAGESQDTFLAHDNAVQRSLDLVDGSDEVHEKRIAKVELAAEASRARALAYSRPVAGPVL